MGIACAEDKHPNIFQLHSGVKQAWFYGWGIPWPRSSIRGFRTWLRSSAPVARPRGKPLPGKSLVAPPSQYRDPSEQRRLSVCLFVCQAWPI